MLAFPDLTIKDSDIIVDQQPPAAHRRTDSMNGQQNYTVKATEALHAAFQMAAGRGNPEATPTHLLQALIEQEGGIASRLLAKVGVATSGLGSECQEALDRHLHEVVAQGGELVAPLLDRVGHQIEGAALN